MIGNDLVDLHQARQESNWRRPRYLEKIFTREEQQLIAAAGYPDTMVWLLWSCKEAAYKRWSSETHQRSFLPKKIAIKDFQETDDHNTSNVEGHLQQQGYTSWVQIADHRYFVQTTLIGDLIHSWTLSAEKKLLLHKVELLGQQDLSKATRSLLYGHLAQYFRWSPTDISIQKNEHGRPFIYYQNKKCKLSLSMTHHGRYGGFLLAEGEG